MKIRLNKQTLSEMPEAVRAVVSEWKSRYRKAHISVENCTSFCPGEDSKVTMFNLISSEQQTERVAGEFAGLTKLSPTADIPLPEGCVAIAQGFFCGMPWLTLYQNSKPQLCH